MRGHLRALYLAYIVALIGPIMVLAASQWLEGGAREFLAPITFVLAVTAAGVLGGWKPGLLFLHRDVHQMRLLERFLRECPLERNSATLPVRALQTSKTQHIADVPQSWMSRVTRNEQMLHIVRELNPRSVITAPLLVRDRPIGTITFVRSDPELLYSPRDVDLAEQLAQRVAIAIDNAELLGSIRAADRQKGEFLAMLAHELRNPLGAIAYAAALLPTADTAWSRI